MAFEGLKGRPSSFVTKLTAVGRGWAKYRDLNNCFIIRSPGLFSYLNHCLTAPGIDPPGIFHPIAWFQLHMSKRSVAANTCRRNCAWTDHYLWAVTCRPSCGPLATEREEKMYQMMMIFNLLIGTYRCHVTDLEDNFSCSSMKDCYSHRYPRIPFLSHY